MHPLSADMRLRGFPSLGVSASLLVPLSSFIVDTLGKDCLDDVSFKWEVVT